MAPIELTETLITLIEKNSAVWDDQSDHYHDNEARQKVWLEIFNELTKREDCTFVDGKMSSKTFETIFDTFAF